MERGLSVVTEPSAEIRYTLAERELIQKGQSSWKDEIREQVDQLKKASTSLPDLAKKLKEQGFETKITKKNISFKHPDYERFVRGKTLGLAYEKETLHNGIERENSGRRSSEARNERGNGKESSAAPLTRTEFAGQFQDDGSSQKLHRNGYGQTSNRETHLRSGINGDQGHQRGNSTEIEDLVTRANQTLDSQQRDIGKGLKRFNESHEPKQRENHSATIDNSKSTQHPIRDNTAEHAERNHENERSRTNRDQQHDDESKPKPRRNSSKDIDHGPER
ncbi:hypothetical protein ACOI1C_22175 [Bacillus sp. DJP31]|uniref:hypothetical protein n=1 Tax=Bacillus sp. DJP31 TaxID=3409789 RepID=UPI003BB54583